MGGGRRLVAAVLSVVLAAPAGAIAAVPDTYDVQVGDSLSAIADRTGVDVDTLVTLNSLADPDLIVVGASLKLREAASPTPSTYEVRSGDTLSEIAGRFGVTTEGLAGLNAITDLDTLATGAKLIVPEDRMGVLSPAASTPEPTPTPLPTPTLQPTPTPTQGPTANPARTPTPLPTSAPRGTPIVGPVVSATPAAIPANAPPVVQIAMRYLGRPYVSAGITPDGFDCSGFVFFVQGLAGRPVGRDIVEQYEAGPHPTDQLRPGDLLFFQDTYMTGLSHNGIYVGNGQFVHAIDEARGVGISALTDDYWRQHWYGATRLT